MALLSLRLGDLSKSPTLIKLYSGESLGWKAELSAGDDWHENAAMMVLFGLGITPRQKKCFDCVRIWKPSISYPLMVDGLCRSSCITVPFQLYIWALWNCVISRPWWWISEPYYSNIHLLVANMPIINIQLWERVMSPWEMSHLWMVWDIEFLDLLI